MSEARVSLLVSAGGGPQECQLAVAKVLDKMREEALVLGVEVEMRASPAKPGVKSAVVLLSGPASSDLAARWRGTVCWRCKSPLRPQHKRANWFVGVFDLPVPAGAIQIAPQDVRFESFRAGGPGGQHQNTTDSAVRAIHKPSGLTAVAREMRSQHRNKALALERLAALAAACATADAEALRRDQHQLHHQLERGNPVRVFKGRAFREVLR